MAGDEHHGSNADKAKDDDLDVMAILGKTLVELFLRHNGLHVPAQGGKNGVPKACTDGGVEQEFPVAHACHSSRDRDEMSDDGHEATSQRGCDAVLVEVALALLHFLLIEQAEMSPPAVGKLPKAYLRASLSIHLAIC